MEVDAGLRGEAARPGKAATEEVRVRDDDLVDAAVVWYVVRVLMYVSAYIGAEGMPSSSSLMDVPQRLHGRDRLLVHERDAVPHHVAPAPVRHEEAALPDAELGRGGDGVDPGLQLGDLVAVPACCMCMGTWGREMMI